MAQARQADWAMPQVAIFAAILVAAIITAAMLATGTLNLPGMQPGTQPRGEVSPALIQAGRDWELQRKQQSGWVDPVIEAGREWERQRKQQSAGSE